MAPKKTVKLNAPGRIPAGNRGYHHDITIQEIATSEALLLQYMQMMQHPFMPIFLRALELAIKPRKLTDDQLMHPTIAQGRHEYQRGAEDLIRLARSVDQLGKVAQSPTPDYEMGSLEDFTASLERHLEPLDQPEK